MEILLGLLVLLIIFKAGTMNSGGYDWHGDDHTKRVLEANNILRTKDEKSSIPAIMAGAAIIFLLLLILAMYTR